MFGKRARWALWAAASLNFSPLTRGQPLVVPNFIPPELTVALRADLLVLQAAGAFRPSGARDATRDAAAARRTRLAPRVGRGSLRGATARLVRGGSAAGRACTGRLLPARPLSPAGLAARPARRRPEQRGRAWLQSVRRVRPPRLPAVGDCGRRRGGAGGARDAGRGCARGPRPPAPPLRRARHDRALRERAPCRRLAPFAHGRAARGGARTRLCLCVCACVCVCV
jgi:hypothetical protein